MIKRKAFTLAELLITLLVIGVIAALTLPSLMTNISNKTMVAQIKNMTANVQQLAADQMIFHKTQNLLLTDFGNPETLLSEDNDFEITKSCAGTTSSTNSCWSSSYSAIDGSDVVIDLGENSVVLKNGVVLSYSTDEKYQMEYGSNDNTIGYFVVDVNGTDGPNIIGRDVFGFYITEKGRVEAPASMSKKDEQGNTVDLACSSGTEALCFHQVMSDNWHMNY